MYEIKKIRKKNKKNFLVNNTSQNSKKNIELSIGEVNGHFYLKIKVKKNEKNGAELLRPAFFDILDNISEFGI